MLAMTSFVMIFVGGLIIFFLEKYEVRKHNKKINYNLW